MDQGKGAHYRNQNVRFDVDFIAKRNVALDTGGAKYGLEILLAVRTRRSVGYGLTLRDKKKAQVFIQTRMMKKTIFKMIGTFSENAVI